MRWKQRLENFKNAHEKLESAASIQNPSDLEKEGTIQRFKFTHELAWKVLKDYLEFEGVTGIVGSRSAVREAFNAGIISNGQIWMNMIESRNRTVHTYQKKILIDEYNKIVNIYVTELKALIKTLEDRQ